MNQPQLPMMWALVSKSQWPKLIGCCWWWNNSRYGASRHAGRLCDTELGMKPVRSRLVMRRGDLFSSPESWEKLDDIVKVPVTKSATFDSNQVISGTHLGYTTPLLKSTSCEWQHTPSHYKKWLLSTRIQRELALFLSHNSSPRFRWLILC